MKKNIEFIFFCLLIIVVLFFLGWTVYENDYLLDSNKTRSYPAVTYETNIPGYSLINYTINNNSVYFLYIKENNYIIKEINTLDNQENVYSYSTSYDCKLQNQNNYPFISCVGDSKIQVYDTKFKTILSNNIDNENNYITYKNNRFNVYADIEAPVFTTCYTYCYSIKYNKGDDLISLYKNNELLETNVLNYQQYENGYITYKSNKINVYNTKNDEYKEYLSPINNLNKTLITIGSNNYYLYILKDKMVQVYNLYNKENFINIDISKVTLNVVQMFINNGNLYLFTDESVYVYDISEIEENDLNSVINYEDVLINNKIKYFQEYYGVNINPFENPSYLSANHHITPTYNYNQIIDALETIEDYFLLYNKDFFQRFYEFGMKGLDFYFAREISGTKDGFDKTDVVGVFLKKNNKYIIILNISGIESLTKIASHETMHAIEDYLKNKGETFENWDDYNPLDFDYSHTYYINEDFSDTLYNNKDNDSIYFVDNYARSSATEDRARLFEYICRGENFDNYSHLNAKINYLKDVLLNNFPELYYNKYFSE